MVFDELIVYCRAKAIADALHPTQESLYRRICRAYSRFFYVPLPSVLLLDPEHVLLAYFENQLDGIDLEENIGNLLDQICTMENPDYEKEKEEGLDDFVDKVEKKEEERMSKKNTLLTKQKPDEEKELGGSVDFSNLDEEGEK